MFESALVYAYHSLCHLRQVILLDLPRPHQFLLALDHADQPALALQVYCALLQLLPKIISQVCVRTRINGLHELLAEEVPLGWLVLQELLGLLQFELQILECGSEGGGLFVGKSFRIGGGRTSDAPAGEGVTRDQVGHITGSKCFGRFVCHAE